MFAEWAKQMLLCRSPFPPPEAGSLEHKGVAAMDALPRRVKIDDSVWMNAGDVEHLLCRMHDMTM